MKSVVYTSRTVPYSMVNNKSFAMSLCTFGLTCMVASCLIALRVTFHSTPSQTIGRLLGSFTLTTDVNVQRCSLRSMRTCSRASTSRRCISLCILAIDERTLLHQFINWERNWRLLHHLLTPWTSTVNVQNRHSAIRSV